MVKIEPSWLAALQGEFEQPYFQGIKLFLQAEKKSEKTIFPPGKFIFNAFDSTPFEQVKVVILGQVPYHGAGQAMGLSFSVPRGVAVPASLKNIYKELQSDLDLPIPNHGDLSAWASQGVFLLNAMLTVEANAAGSHQKIGWQTFTNAVIKKLSDDREGIVFLLWGNFARAKKEFIDDSKHFILESAHPSPLAGNAFAGNKHFSKTNQFLEAQGKTPIDWRVG